MKEEKEQHSNRLLMSLFRLGLALTEAHKMY